MGCYRWGVLITTHNPGYATAVGSMSELYDKFLPLLVGHGKIKLVSKWNHNPTGLCLECQKNMCRLLGENDHQWP